MRLTSYQETIIKKLTAEIFGSDARLMLFGSRVDDTKKGGDIDLYIETTDVDTSFDKKIKLLTALNLALGEQKIDLIVNNFTKEKAIYEIAKQTGIQL
ncbi:MAG: nucleotidyltransferase domain-containing protein [Methylococcales bacterium]|nr:nucleotidyltransferase domain-containing protein [Methylococcales bacterium]